MSEAAVLVTNGCAWFTAPGGGTIGVYPGHPAALVPTGGGGTQIRYVAGGYIDVREGPCTVAEALRRALAQDQEFFAGAYEDER